ncbi:hypothetical protein HWV62_28072 [Athelia sp. TMB]|nr:hypothetical protein HWV62_28072 [Athelia sp. TMB]
MASWQSMQALVQARDLQRASLFPRLHTLDWTLVAPQDDESLERMPLFLGKAIRRIIFGLDMMQFQPQALAILQSLLLDYPSIQHIKIECRNLWRDDFFLTRAITPLICHSVDLRSVELVGGHISVPIMDHLAGLENLAFLGAQFNDRLSPRHSQAFKALKDITLHCKSYRTISSLLHTLAAPSTLNTAKFTIQGKDNEEDGASSLGEFTGLINAMRLHLAPSCFQDLFVNDIYQQPFTINEAVLRPLLAFQNITDMNLVTHNTFEMGDRMVRDMAAAWPKLRILTLGGFGWSQRSSVTPAGLICLLSLPHMKHLNIAIDASHVNLPEIGDVSINTAITRIYLQDSIIEDVQAMASTLSLVVPNLKTIVAGPALVHNPPISNELAKVYKGRWREVADLVPIYAKEALSSSGNSLDTLSTTHVM